MWDVMAITPIAYLPFPLFIIKIRVSVILKISVCDN